MARVARARRSTGSSSMAVTRPTSTPARETLERTASPEAFSKEAYNVYCLPLLSRVRPLTRKASMASARQPASMNNPTLISIPRLVISRSLPSSRSFQPPRRSGRPSSGCSQAEHGRREQKVQPQHGQGGVHHGPRGDRKSTRLNSSHVAISYAVFCLKKKKYDDTYT